MDSTHLPAAALTLAVDDAELVLAPAVGGAVIRWLWRGREMLRDTPPAALVSRNVQLAACWPLVPYSNRIRDGRFVFDGEHYRVELNFGDHPHAIHGVGWQRPWEVAAVVDRSHPPTDEELELLELSGFDRDGDDFAAGALAVAVLEYGHRPAGDDAAWPFAFAAQQCFTVAPTFVGMQMTIENRDPRPMPCGFGWHPFFAKAGAELDVDVAGVWEGDATRIPLRYVSPAPWPLANWVRAEALDLDHCFRRARNGRIAVRWAERGFGVDIRAPDVFEHVVVYAPPDRDHLCIEAVTNMNDAFNELARGNDRTGTLVLQPGESTTAGIVMAPFELDDAGSAT